MTRWFRAWRRRRWLAKSHVVSYGAFNFKDKCVPHPAFMDWRRRHPTSGV